jgi:hypothetical protein
MLVRQGSGVDRREGLLMDKPERELTGSQLDGACGASVGSLQHLVHVFVMKANYANADLLSAADHQRQLNSRMDQLRAAQARLGDLQI